MRETDADFGRAHDAMLAAYSAHAMEVYCATKGCPNRDGVTVTWYSEYGQTWTEPEECPRCGGELLDIPADDDEDDDDAPESDSAGISAPPTDLPAH